MNWSAWGLEVDGGEGQDVHVLVSVEAGKEQARAPVVVNLLLDRSGSMKGAPLVAAVEAAQQFVDLAGPDDFLGLLVFDGVAEQRVPVTPMDVRGKRRMLEALGEIEPGRGTALHQAVELGAKALQRLLVPGRRPKLLMLTDGEPSVGPETDAAFEGLGAKLAQAGIAVHALGLARHYVAEILAGLTLPSGNAFEHVDGPEGLSEAMGAVVSHLFGEVGSGATVRVQPRNFRALACRHSYPTSTEQEALVVSLGNVSGGLARRVLFSGSLSGTDWDVSLSAHWTQRSDQRHQRLTVERVRQDSPQGRLINGLVLELDLVAAETAAWLSLARRESTRAHQQLDLSERHLRELVALAPEGIAIRRHLERLADLRIAIERGEGDLPLLMRRAKSARAGTHVSRVIPLQVVRGDKA